MELNSNLSNRVKVIFEELQFHGDTGESYASYVPPSGYVLASAFLQSAPNGYFGVKLVKRNADGSYTICLNWSYTGNWSTILILISW